VHAVRSSVWVDISLGLLGVALIVLGIVVG
jgi:hypothetical protein